MASLIHDSILMDEKSAGFGGNVDATLHALGGRSRYQMLQLLVINMGVWGAAFQLLDNLFIGRKVTWHQCAPPANSSLIPRRLKDVDWSDPDQVTYGECELTVTTGKRLYTFPCLYGYEYDYDWRLSFRTEFDLVCHRSLMAEFLQTLVIMGQGLGAVVASFLSDRYGRKGVLVCSQLGLLVVGMAIAAAPSYSVLAVLKFIVGSLQQGVMTGKATMSSELFPTDSRSLTSLLMTSMWMVGSCTMALTSYMLQDFSWRVLQCVLSSVSLIAFLQMWYLDESLRWLVTNGRESAAVRVLQRAAAVNELDLGPVLQTLYRDRSLTLHAGGSGATEGSSDMWDGSEPLPEPSSMDADSKVERGPLKAQTQEVQTSSTDLTLLDVFRHRRMRRITFLIWFAWSTCTFTTFSLVLMSTSLHGNRYLNFCLTTMMGLPAGLLLYWVTERFGRKPAVALFFFIAALGVMTSGFFRIFDGSFLCVFLSLVTAMFGMMGAKGIFGSMFFYTPELYPTNVRQQALGVASLAGRVGGMIAPFMVPLSEIIVWAPGAITGTLCFVVVFLFRFLPETKGREMPETLSDVDGWFAETPKDTMTTTAFADTLNLSWSWSQTLDAIASIKKLARVAYKACRSGLMGLVRLAADIMHAVTRFSYVDVDGRSEAPV